MVDRMPNRFRWILKIRMRPHGSLSGSWLLRLNDVNVIEPLCVIAWLKSLISSSSDIIKFIGFFGMKKETNNFLNNLIFINTSQNIRKISIQTIDIDILQWTENNKHMKLTLDVSGAFFFLQNVCCRSECIKMAGTLKWTLSLQMNHEFSNVNNRTIFSFFYSYFQVMHFWWHG